MSNEKNKQCLVPPKKKDALLRRVYSHIPNEKSTSESSQIELIKCDCCGMSEECTLAFISGVRKIFCGKWVCGICSEAVKEIVKRQPNMIMEEALESHISVCFNFNNTTRLNPKLSFAGAMRDIARRNSLRRRSMDSVHERSKMSRTMSCGPWLEISQSSIQ
ncbi:hypothetical protein LUZ61_005971 [Rhynchospora tenuis]|uniref:Uncharacterized protein n=1 Tax=Rhynchospora tenuis TaxID=198213 RepID=A0AAD6EV26_9POAL|nr:hypothetical protein LUZ61_005971 [Rhynchospora tenuis]